MYLIKGRFSYQLLLFTFLFLTFLGTGQVLGQTNTWDGSSSANWNTAANWSLNLVPTAAHDVVIPNGITATITVNTAAVCNSLTFIGGNQPNTVTISGSNSLTVTNGVNIAAGSQMNDNKILAVNAGTLSCASIAITGTGGSNRTSQVTISTGTATVGGSITMGANNFVTFSGAGTLNIGGVGTMSGGTLTPSSGTVNYNGTSQTVGAYTYNNLTLSGSGVKTLQAGTTTINGNLTLSGTASTSAVTGLNIGGAFTLGLGTSFTAGAYTHDIAGNWVNNGGTFTNTGSTIDLDGAGQSIGGTSSTTFNNLALSGSGTKTFNFATTIANNLSIAGTAVANLGTFTTHTANTLTLDGSYRRAGTWGSTSSIATYTDNGNFSATTGYITIATFPTVTAVNNGNWNNAATWDCNCVPPAYSDVTIPAGITVTIPSFSLVDFRNATDVIITVSGTLVLNDATLYINPTDQIIINTGGNLVSAGFFGGTIATGPFNFPYILSWLGSPLASNDFDTGDFIPGPASITGGVLPIKLLYFTGRQFEKEVVLEWASATEENFDYYRVEKSLDGQKFEELNRVKGSEFSNEKKEYSLVDPFPVSGKIYYRLVAVDLDGSSEQFQVILVNFDAGEKRIYAYPNPVSQGEYLVVQPNFRIAEGDAIIIYNNLGQTLYQTTFMNSMPISIETKSWEPGMYFLNIYSKEGRFIEKVVIR